MSNTITITGNSGRDPELRFTQGGKAVLNGVVADTPRKFNRDTNQWEDAGDTLWLEWSIWDQEAEALAETVRKGTKVTVTGKLKARSYETKDGEKRTVTEIAADSVAVHPKRDLQSSPPRQQPQQSARGGDDPWATSTNTDNPSF